MKLANPPSPLTPQIGCRKYIYYFRVDRKRILEPMKIRMAADALGVVEASIHGVREHIIAVP